MAWSLSVCLSDLHMKPTPLACVKTRVRKGLPPACPGSNTHAPTIRELCGIECLGKGPAHLCIFILKAPGQPDSELQESKSHHTVEVPSINPSFRASGLHQHPEPGWDPREPGEPWQGVWGGRGHSLESEDHTGRASRHSVSCMPLCWLPSCSVI